ncbi:MAG TPA: hypothetical protein VEA99_16215, partial [Gemmatimonadaceae bacterium]|nr:hypothetical protein [Gemmatimonadaceae bacterium]
MNHRRSVPWPLVALAAIAAGGARLGAQCVGDLQKETTALESLAVAIKEAAMKKPGEKGSYWKQYLDALGNEALYGQHLMKAGTATPCLLDRREAFRTAARTALVERVKDPEKLNDSNADDVAEALRSGAFTVLGSRYSPTDRFGVFFGFGASYIHQAHDARRYKVISQTETVTTPGANGQPSTQTSQTKQYIVEDSRSRSYPVGATGLTMRFRERNSSRGQGCFRMSGDPSAKGQSRNDGQKVVHSLAECVVW